MEELKFIFEEIPSADGKQRHSFEKSSHVYAGLKRQKEGANPSFFAC